MSSHRAGLVVFAVVWCIGVAAGARGQPCQPGWAGGFAASDLDGPGYAAVVFDDGQGPAVYVAGGFRYAGGQFVSTIARWNGTSWLPLGTGVDGGVSALAVHDDGSGPALYVGGQFTTAGGVSARNIARWNGTVWAPVGPGAGGPELVQVVTLISADLGSGPRLFAGGDYQSGAGSYIAVWDGAAWSPTGPGFNGAAGVQALAVYDDGGGRALYAAGLGVQKLAAGAWTVVPNSPNANVWAMETFNDGTGEALYIGGNFASVNGVATRSIARLNGTTWQSVGGGVTTGVIPGTVYGLRKVDDGLGPKLFVGGTFTAAGGISAAGAATWSGAGWAPLAAGVAGTVYDFVRADFGGPAAVYAVGSFAVAAGQPANNVARWSGAEWSALSPAGAGVSGPVSALALHDDGGGPAVYAGGSFTAAGGAASRGVARWNGSAWSGLVGGIQAGDVLALASHDDGTGRGLIVGGSYSLEGTGQVNLARWRNSQWTPLIPDAQGTVRAVLSSHVGGQPSLYIGGDFTNVAALPANRVARRRGGTWGTLGTGMNARMHALIEADLGSGAAVYAAGEFTTAGGVTARYVAKWDGQAWSALGGGPAREARALAVYNDGSGAALYASDTLLGVHKWNGAVWTQLPDPGFGPVCLATFDDGSGPALYAGAGGLSVGPFNRIARWNGTSWSGLGSGLGGTPATASALLPVIGAGRPMLYVGGNFQTAGGTPSSRIAVWEGCPACYANCDGSTVAPVLNVNDFICFQTRFASGSPAANCDGSVVPPVLNVNDFVCFLGRYAAGCP